MINIKKLWDLMSKDEFGPEPLVIEVDEGEIEVSTLSCMNESGQDGLYISGRGKTLEEALKKFEIDLDEYLLDVR
jgi:hypothetical protein